MMTFEKAVKRYLKRPTKKYGNPKNAMAHQTLGWMAGARPEGLKDPVTKQVIKYSQYYHDKYPDLTIVWDETAGMFKGREMASITSLDVTNMEDVLTDDKGLSPAGVNNYLRYLRAVVNFSRKKLSVKFLDPPEFELGEEDHREEYLEPQDAAKLIRWLDPLRSDMVRFAVATGLRNTNVTNFKWEYWNTKTGDIIIPKEHLKNGSPHHFIVTKAALEVLRYRHSVREHLIKTYPHLTGGMDLDYVFVQTSPNHYGKKFYRSTLSNKTWKRAVMLAGLPLWVRFHSMRHTFATWHVARGTSDRELMAAGGWKSQKAVGRYIHEDKKHKAEVARRLDGIELIY